MKTTAEFARARFLAALLWPVILAAQVAPTPDAATLARFDLNKNGRLDPDELRTWEAEQKKNAPVVTAVAPAQDEAVVLSPFEVVADTKGYFAANTMSGTRLNTKLEDLASPISVVTKEQMADFAMLDINDVFLYSLNTEGTGTYTEYTVTDSSQGELTDTVSGDPANANRIRSLGSANISSDNFETSNRVPLDPIDADGIEISRGPNANIFGLGNASGTVNIVGATANLQRNRSQVSFRADSTDGYRASLDVSRVLLKNKLAVRVSAVRQHDGFDLKPSGVDTDRLNAMLQFRPFKGTTIKSSLQHYRSHGTRPNSLPPLDGISGWAAAGRPVWDPLTNSLLRSDGVTLIQNNAPGSYLITPAANFNQAFITPNGLEYLTTTYGITGNALPGSPQSSGVNTRKFVLTRALTDSSQPLVGVKTRMVSDKSVYDWSSINLAAPNHFADQTNSFRTTVDQMVFDRPRHSLALQLGWFHEGSDRYTNFPFADGRTNGPTGVLSVDVNTRLLDGKPNPYFLRPLLALPTPRSRKMPLRTDDWRGQAAYKFDFTKDEGFRRWLGRHSLVGYAEYKEKVQRSYAYSPGLVGFGTSNGSNYNRYYVGDNQGFNVDYAPGNYTNGNYNLIWGNAITGVFNNTPVTIGDRPGWAPSALGGVTGTRTLQKTNGGIFQSSFLSGRVATTFGLRRDRQYTRAGVTPTAASAAGEEWNYEMINKWRPGDWQKRTGNTMQGGVVVRPFRELPIVERALVSGSAPARVIAGVLNGLAVHYNRSESFSPAAPSQDIFGKFLPDPSGRSKDYGFSLNLLEGRLVARVNKYETRQINSRNGASATLASTLAGIDFTNTAFALQLQAGAWITAANPGITPDQLNAQLTKVMGVAPRDLSVMAAYPPLETDDVLGRGHEVEIHFNPTRYWTMTANLTEQETVNAHLAPNVRIYNNQRLALWTSIVDPRTGQLWWNTLYGGSETAAQFYARKFTTPYATALSTDGLSRPQVRRYRANLSNNLRLSGFTNHRLLRSFNVGGALRYESRGAIGYRGIADAAGIYQTYDFNQPIWDKEHYYLDAFIGYRTKVWGDKVGATFQLNVRNLQEDGRLQPISAFPDGAASNFRIVSPRQFILSASFDL